LFGRDRGDELPEHLRSEEARSGSEALRSSVLETPAITPFRAEFALIPGDGSVAVVSPEGLRSADAAVGRWPGVQRRLKPTAAERSGA
jgi:hypothetical protein